MLLVTDQDHVADGKKTQLRRVKGTPAQSELAKSPPKAMKDQFAQRQDGSISRTAYCLQNQESTPTFITPSVVKK